MTPHSRPSCDLSVPVTHCCMIRDPPTSLGHHHLVTSLCSVGAAVGMCQTHIYISSWCNLIDQVTTQVSNRKLSFWALFHGGVKLLTLSSAQKWLFWKFPTLEALLISKSFKSMMMSRLMDTNHFRVTFMT